MSQLMRKQNSGENPVRQCSKGTFLAHLQDHDGKIEKKVVTEFIRNVQVV